MIRECLGHVKKNEYETPVCRIGGGAAEHPAALPHSAGSVLGALYSVVYFEETERRRPRLDALGEVGGEETGGMATGVPRTGVAEGPSFPESQTRLLQNRKAGDS